MITRTELLTIIRGGLYHWEGVRGWFSPETGEDQMDLGIQKQAEDLADQIIALEALHEVVTEQHGSHKP